MIGLQEQARPERVDIVQLIGSVGLRCIGDVLLVGVLRDAREQQIARKDRA